MRISDWSSDVCSSDLVRHALAELRRPGKGGQRQVRDVVELAPLPPRPRSRVERPLVAGGEEESRVGPDNGLRAVAVIHVEVNGRDALHAMDGAGLKGPDSDGADHGAAPRPSRPGLGATGAR